MNRRNTIMLTALREMCAGKKITALDYAKRFDTTRLGARIYDLRNLKENKHVFIMTNRCKDKYGEVYFEYYIHKLQRKNARELLKQLESNNRGRADRR